MLLRGDCSDIDNNIRYIIYFDSNSYALDVGNLGKFAISQRLNL